LAAVAETERAIAMQARSLRKHYRLGQLHSLRQTVDKVIRPSAPAPAGIEALAGVDFTVYRGDAFGLVGTNGSGKSTLLQILAGTTMPTGGELEVHGRVLPLLAVGTGFHSELSGRENVTLFGASLGIPINVAQERMEDIAAFAELEEHLDTPIKRYSTGMISRLSFAIAMSFPADIYIFDEVLAVVDGEFEARCLEEINRLHDDGRTVIFVSHNLHQVSEVCNRVVWLDHGHVRDVGDAKTVLDEYQGHHPSRSATAG
jgi:ABC-type polysaccharide/polyol phosphate transport system ATPase subunit